MDFNDVDSLAIGDLLVFNELVNPNGDEWSFNKNRQDPIFKNLIISKDDLYFCRLTATFESFEKCNDPLAIGDVLIFIGKIEDNGGNISEALFIIHGKVCKIIMRHNVVWRSLCQLKSA